MKNNIKKLVLVLLLCVVPKYTLFADEATHKLDIGVISGLRMAGYGFSYEGDDKGKSFILGGSIGLQSQWSNPWIAMINTFEASYSFGTLRKHQSLEYNIGMRIFLGTPYVFFDGFIGLYQFLAKESPYLLGGAGIGFNIPIIERLNFQIILYTKGKMTLIWDNSIKIGVQFTL